VCGVLWPLSACTDPSLEGVEYPQGGDEGGGSITLTINRDVDILLVVDNSGSMAEEQVALAAGFGSFIEVLERPEVAANYRIGITTTDNGNPLCGNIGAEQGALRLSSCRSRPEEFELDGLVDPVVDACVPACPEEWTDIEIQPTVISGSDELRARSWIERIEGRTNLPEGLSTTQAFQCVAPQGIDGCGFESHLESMWHAMRRTQSEDDPAFGFMRSNAVLSVVHVTDEEDCSYNPDWETIFLPEGNRVFWSDPEAESPTSAVCWNAGVVCEGAGPYDECRPIDLEVDGTEVSEDADELAVLRPMSRYIDLLQELEIDKQNLTPDQEVLVSIIAGVGSDGRVTYQDAVDPMFQQDFGIGPGCESSMGRAVPPVRLRELAEAFDVGDDRNMFSVCDEDYSVTLATIAEAIASQLKPACVPTCVADIEPETPDVLDPSCRFVQETPQDDGSFEELNVLPCEADGSVPVGDDVCFVFLTGDELDEFCAEAGFNLEVRLVRPEGFPAPAGTSMKVVCTRSQDKAIDCPDLP
jgi:hypothetical protein